MSCAKRPGPNGAELIPYQQAVLLIEEAARETARYLAHGNHKQAVLLERREETRGYEETTSVVTVSLLDAAGHLSAATIHATKDTPENDTSAMDGFAVCSQKTMQASDTSPMIFTIVGSIAAGDTEKFPAVDHTNENICIEIMTGAQFPESAYPSLDAVVMIEDVIVVEQWSTKDSITKRYIQVSRPVKPQQHRRPAGSDFSVGNLVIDEGTVIEPQHIAALASLGVANLSVRKLRNKSTVNPKYKKQLTNFKVGILSTGSEVVPSEVVGRTRKGQQIADSNGPYLTSALLKYLPHGKVEHLGIAADTDESLCKHLKNAIDNGYDMIITSGGVSKGRYDLVRHVVEKKLEGHIVFHGVAVRPGAPILFATCEAAGSGSLVRRRVAIFGAPGNPLAAAMALRFFVLPYIEALSPETIVMNGRLSDTAVTRVFQSNNGVSTNFEDAGEPLVVMRRKPKDLTVFWLAKRRKDDKDRVDVIEDQASYKLTGLLIADCWVIATDSQHEVHQGDRLTCCTL